MKLVNNDATQKNDAVTYHRCIHHSNHASQLVQFSVCARLCRRAGIALFATLSLDLSLFAVTEWEINRKPRIVYLQGICLPSLSRRCNCVLICQLYFAAKILVFYITCCLFSLSIETVDCIQVNANSDIYLFFCSYVCCARFLSFACFHSIDLFMEFEPHLRQKRAKIYW